MEEKKKIIVICGPTASGKTALGIKIANDIKGEIVSADSMQIYKDMDIGTAKPTKEEQKMAKHYLIDFVSPDVRYSVADFKRDATEAIETIIKKNKTPIIVGGTGLYINSLIYNIDFNSEGNTDLEFRSELEKRDIGELYNMAKKIDKDAISKISPNDRKRIMRIIEIYHSTGKTKTQLEKESLKENKYDYRIFVLNWDRKKLYEKINLRVDLMIKNGLIEEVQNLLKKYNEFPTSFQGLGYKEVKEYLDGNLTKDEMIEKIKQESRRYAKRQITWFKRYKDAIWLDGENKNNEQIVLDEISKDMPKDK